MALIKQHTLINGAVGEYWRVNRLALDEITGTMTVTLALYKDEAQRLAAVGYPLPHEVTFTFMGGDHPISEIDMQTPILAPPQDIPAALMYRHIRAVAEFAGTVAEENRTQNEHRAVWLMGDCVSGGWLAQTDKRTNDKASKKPKPTSGDSRPLHALLGGNDVYNFLKRI